VNDYLDSLFRRRWILVGVALAVFGLTLLITARTRPRYESNATLMVEPGNKDDFLSQGRGAALLSLNAPRIANHVELLKSLSLAEQVAERLPDSLVQELLRRPASGGRHEGANPQLETRIPGLAKRLQAMVTARPVRDADIVQIRITAPSPGLALAVANLYALTYQDYNLDLSRADVSAIRQFIEGQLDVVGRRLDSSEQSQERFKRTNHFVDLDAETKALIERQSSVIALYQQTSTESQGNAAQLDYVRSQIEQESRGMTSKLEDIASPLVANLKATLDQLGVERANLLVQGYPENSARIQSLTRQTDEIRHQLAQESERLIRTQGFIDPVGRLKDLHQSALVLETQLASDQTRAAVLGTATADYDAALRQLPTAERQLARLTRNLETDRRVYSLMSERYEEARIQEVGRIPTVRIVDAAQGARKSRPNVPMNLTLGILLALTLACATAFAVDYLDTSVHNHQQLEQHGLAVLANIPLLGRSHRLRKGEITAHLLTHADPESSGAEAFRMLRTGVSFASIDNSVHTILVTSAGPGEGKSTVAVNLATVLAQAGHRTLLVDADLRRPILHSIFRHRKKPGFTDLVLTGGNPNGTIFTTGIEHLSCLPSGTIPPSPADLLNSSATGALLGKLGLEYDYVVIDSPPLMVAADTAILAPKADATILVVRADRTSIEAVEHARKILGTAGTRLLGGVFNGVRHSRRYGRYYYYYHYRYHYARASRQPSPATHEREEGYANTACR
jgi:tyrosine-protein kinase Etk/Wzc